MIKPELKVTGYRGVWGDSLTEDIAISHACAFGEFLKTETDGTPTILIGRDGRESGPIIANAIVPALKDMGINVIYGDILPTPTIMFSVNKNNYDGAIIITASHNPPKYNGLKFVVRGGRMTNDEEVEKIKDYLSSPETEKAEQSLQNLNRVGAPVERVKRANFEDFAKPEKNFAKEHADFVLKNIDVEKIRARKFRVAVDMINASACVIDPYMFEKLGVELIAINDTPDGKFAHEPEPIIENLGEIAKIVKENKCDIGFAQDPDADRLVVVNEDGQVIMEDYTLAFGTENILSKNPGRTVVVNMSTSQTIGDIAESHGSKFVRTKVGESHVFAGIEKENAIIGGEGTSGIIYPTINNCRDSFVSICLVLELLAERGQSVNELIDSLPKYFMERDKESVEGKNLKEMYEKLKSHFPDAKINEEDGLRLDLPDKSWIHLRPSNTEPIIRLFGEAKTKERVKALFKEAKQVIA